MRSIKQVLLLFCWVTEAVSAIGLGPLEMYSYLNQPLRAEIALTAAEAYNEKQLRVTLADPKAYARQQLERPLVLTDLSFNVIRWRAQTVIYITSKKPIKTPFLECLLQLTSPEGKLIKAVTFLLDPLPLTPTTPKLTLFEQREAAPPETKNARPKLTKRLIQQPTQLYALSDEPTKPTSAMQQHQQAPTLDLGFLKEEVLALEETAKDAAIPPAMTEDIPQESDDAALFEPLLPVDKMAPLEEESAALSTEAMTRSLEQLLEEPPKMNAPPPEKTLPASPAPASSSSSLWYLLQLGAVFIGLGWGGYVLWGILERRRRSAADIVSPVAFKQDNLTEVEQDLEQMVQMATSVTATPAAADDEMALPTDELLDEEDLTLDPAASEVDIDDDLMEEATPSAVIDDILSVDVDMTQEATSAVDRPEEEEILVDAPLTTFAETITESEPELPEEAPLSLTATDEIMVEEAAPTTSVPIDTDGLRLVDDDSTQTETFATKLELAQQYQELGDIDNAKELLQDIIKHAEAPLAAQAQALLEALKHPQ